LWNTSANPDTGRHRDANGNPWRHSYANAIMPAD
jgi:hypothetical protein